MKKKIDKGKKSIIFVQQNYIITKKSILIVLNYHKINIYN